MWLMPCRSWILTSMLKLYGEFWICAPVKIVPGFMVLNDLRVPSGGLQKGRV